MKWVILLRNKAIESMQSPVEHRPYHARRPYMNLLFCWSSSISAFSFTIHEHWALKRLWKVTVFQSNILIPSDCKTSVPSETTLQQ